MILNVSNRTYEDSFLFFFLKIPPLILKRFFLFLLFITFNDNQTSSDQIAAGKWHLSFVPLIITKQASTRSHLFYSQKEN